MKVLIIEDELSLQETMKLSLEREGFVVETAGNYSQGLLKIEDYNYDCILLDIMLPGGNGLMLLEELKRMGKKESVIIVSAKDSIDDKVAGLNLGADDYLAKPFHLAELNARVKSVIRRNKAGGSLEITLGNMVVYPDLQTVKINNKELVLNRKEFSLLYYFITNPNRLINKIALAESVWGDHIDQADNFDFIYSQVKNLRKKLTLSGASVEIKAVYGFGYKMVTE